MATASWSENVRAGGTAIEIVVDAIDMERTEAGELESFKKALAVVPEERDMEVTDGDGGRMSTLGFLKLSYFVAGLFVAGLVTALIAKGFSDSGPPLSGGAVIGIFVFLVAAPHLGKLGLRVRGRSRNTKVRDQFTLGLDASGFTSTCSAGSGPAVPLASIERFEDDGRLVVVTKDGRRTRLALALETRFENAQLAERLNDALRDVRANAGYRGALPRVERMDGEGEEDAEDQGRRRG